MGSFAFNGPYNHTMAICPNDVPKSHKLFNHYPIKAWGFSFGHSLGCNWNSPLVIGATNEMAELFGDDHCDFFPWAF